MADPDQITVHADHTGKCPGCGRTVVFDAEDGAVFHALPMCTDFDERDALEFATYYREHIECIERESKQLKLAQDMGGQNQIGYQRADLPLFHTIARAPGGAVFSLDDHFDKCDVCKHHGVTIVHFNAFMARQHKGKSDGRS